MKISMGNLQQHSAFRQKGVAVITALLLTTLAVTIVASLFWQQQVQVRAIENQRMQLQKQWILRGALDWAQLILRESDRTAISGTVTLQQPWAVGLAETRLDSYVENGRSDSEASDATITGKIIDAQSLLNLRNLSVNGKESTSAIAVFKRLLDVLRLDPALAAAAAKAMAAGQAKAPLPEEGMQPLPATATQLEFAYIEDLLSVPGFTPEIVKKLRGHVIFLPRATAVNVNTASAEVLQAIVDKLPPDGAKTMALARDKVPFNNTADMNAYIKDRFPTVVKEPDAGLLDVTSTYFLVDGKVKLNRAGLDVRALIERQPGKDVATKIRWVRENQ